MRGSGSTNGASECTIKVTRTSLADRKAGRDDVVTLINETMKEAEEFADMFFDMVPVDIGEAKPGLAIHQRDKAIEAKDTGTQLKGAQKTAEEIVLAAFREADASEIPMAGVLQRVADDPDVTTAGRPVNRRSNAKSIIRKAGKHGGRFWVSGEDGAERLTLFNPDEGEAKPKDDTIPD
jgi:hypothetical protein